ncbi:MAG TPA: hypothetical protein VFX98_03785, partial [Longimicrobiaceae bacterium]|nr:hypothetical protein [Longimicrobiaceae bacterium]
MPDADATDFLHLLAAAAQRDGDPDALAARAVPALAGALGARKSVVLDVQFTGFMEKGQLVGGVDPQLLRAAGQLIMLRVSRVGFTRDAGEADLAAFFHAVGKTPGDLGGDGLVGVLRGAQPHGIYLSTATGEVYRPPAATREEPQAAAETVPPPTVEAPPPEPAAGEETAAAPPEAPRREEAAAGGRFDWDFAAEPEEHELSAFEVLDVLDTEERRAPAAPAPPPERAPAAAHEPPSTDMYHFFRTAAGGGDAENEVEALPGLLHAADNIARFDDLTQ